MTSLALLPGLGADARFFAPLARILGQQHGIDVVIPRWIEPRPQEPMHEYAARFVAEERALREVDVVGGASFGGMVAREVAAVTKPRALVLLGSALEPARIPGFARFAAGLPHPGFAHDVMKALGVPLSSVFGARNAEERALFGAMLRDTSTSFLRWAVGAIGRWRASPLASTTSVLSVHGARDLVLSAKRARPDVLVAEAGHLLAYTHATECAAAIQTRLQ